MCQVREGLVVNIKSAQLKTGWGVAQTSGHGSQPYLILIILNIQPLRLVVAWYYGIILALGEETAAVTFENHDTLDILTMAPFLSRSAPLPTLLKDDLCLVFASTAWPSNETL